MELKIYAIRDMVVNEFKNLFELRNDEEAIRSFKMECQNADKRVVPINDYQLFKLGTRDTITGEIKSEINFLIGGAEACTTTTGTDQNNKPTSQEKN